MGLALVKFLLDSGVGVDSVDERGQTALQMAARNGDMQIVGFLLDNGAAVDLADLRRRRPLAFAVEGNHRAAVAVLLDRGADVNAMDNIGATPLAIALSEEQYADLIPLLLAKSPSPIVGVDVHVWNLISAAAEGDKTAVDNSLDEGVDVNARDGYGFTALYEASRFGHADIVIRLIAAGANPNEKVGLAGETALHGVVDRTNSFAGFLKQKLSHDEVRNQPSIRGTTPNLTEAHVQVTRCLLESGAVLNLKRWDGETVRNIVDKKLYCVPLQEQLDQDDKKILRDILEQLESPPAVGRYVGGAWRPSPPKLDAKKEEVCEYFKTRIQYHRMTTSRGCLRKDADERLVAARRNQSGPACSHDDCNKNTFKYRITPVLDFLYRRGDREANSEQKKIIELDTWAHAQDGPEWNHEHWRWIHLPANNKLWVKHTIRILHKFTTLKQSRMLDAFIDDSYDEYRGWAPHSRYRKATFTRLFGSRGDAFSLVIPYFDMERDAYLHRKVHLKDDHYRMKQQLEDAYLVGGKDPENLHLSCTLDQSYYLSLKDTSSRDHTQVVFRHTQRQEQEKMDTDARKAVRRRGGVEPRIQKTDAPVSGSGHPSRKKLLMVGHLWLWKLDANTVITAFPDRWDQGSEDDLAGHISRQLGQEPPNTLDETIVQIVYGAAGFVDGPTNAGLDENLFDIFEQSIATLADRQAKSYDTFEKLQQAMQKVVAGGPNAIGPGGKSVEDQISDISQEIQYLREIKDIRDELNMIERILEDQRRVTRMLLDAVNYKGRRKGWDDGWGEDLSQASEFRLSKIGKLHKQAKAVETSLNQLLDLKQKQGNLNEARDTRKLADEADARARAGEFQERVLFIFTVVTVIYVRLFCFCLTPAISHRILHSLRPRFPSARHCSPYQAWTFLRTSGRCGRCRSD